ncbi:SDR family NAD(P)-dependent oxidoreductase [Dactylosporangium sp. CA-092794]|uniref:SDR family NAD(P)-dependent oxidoreductase n=1 Tax=Dactylosporangium sp. CA-092794 TaxID=3239929 RepID=UPI003D89EBFC
MHLADQTALITGASSGLGAAFARELAARGAHLILVARSRDKLEALAARLRAADRVRVDVLPADLTRPDAVTRLGAQVDALGRGVDILINDAGFGTYGDVIAADPVRLHDQVQLNVAALLDLTRTYLPGMTARGRGVIINVASLSAFQPMPHMAVYAATKAFVLSFTEALWTETRPSGVRVLALCPGPTATPFHAATGSEDGSFGKHRTPEQVVATALRALDRDVPSVVDGRFNAFNSRLSGLLPRRLTLAIVERAMRPSHPHVRRDPAQH